jgi:hypothetical protein
MIPKEKAKELICNFSNVPLLDNYEAKQCALLAVKEMLSNDGWSSSLAEWNTFKNYFEEVKQEIMNL